MSEGSAEFYRGPHDGLVLNVDEILRYCQLVRMQSEDRERLFAMMPALVEWDRVIRGDRDEEAPFDGLYAYELHRSGEGAAFLFRTHDEFAEAVEESRSE